ncbi:MAG: hypothetical protein J6C99_07280 [Lachnospiraceae bacterium]|nr:hypothetical protein [Lachnospiraceae bacterium]
MKKRHTGLVVLVMLEITALIVIVVLGIMKMLKPDKEARTVHTTEATSEEVTQEATPTEAEAATEADTEAATEAEVTEPELSADIQKKLADMTLEEKVSLMFVVSPEKLTGEDKVTIAGNVTRNCLEQYHVGGLCYSHTNYVDETQIKDLLTNTQTMAIDVMGYTPILFARDNRSKDMIYASRTNVGGLCSVLATENGVKTTESGALVTKLLCYPSDDAAGTADIVMLDAASGEDDALACMSADAVKNYRSENNYTGILMTGRLDDTVVTSRYTSAEAVVAAVQAGVDMVYEPENFEEAYNALVKAVNDDDVDEADIDKAAGRILTYMDSVGYLPEDAGEE